MNEEKLKKVNDLLKNIDCIKKLLKEMEFQLSSSPLFFNEHCEVLNTFFENVKDDLIFFATDILQKTKEEIEDLLIK